MANDEKTKTASAEGQRALPTALEKARRAGDGIAVAEMKFESANGIEIPIDTAHGSRWNRVHQLIANKNSNGITYRIEYWPWMRHHYVEALDERGTRAAAFLISEAMVSSWVPAA